MNNDTNLLITLSNGEYLLKVAVKVNFDMFTGDVLEYPMEPENKKQIHAIMPLHCRTFGDIVDVEQIFELKDLVQAVPERV